MPDGAACRVRLAKERVQPIRSSLLNVVCMAVGFMRTVSYDDVTRCTVDGRDLHMSFTTSSLPALTMKCIDAVRGQGRFRSRLTRVQGHWQKSRCAIAQGVLGHTWYHSGSKRRHDAEPAMPLNREYSVKTLQSRLARVESVLLLLPPNVAGTASDYVHEQQMPWGSLHQARDMPAGSGLSYMQS